MMPARCQAWMTARRRPRLRALVKSVLQRLPREDSRRPRREESLEGYCLSCGKCTTNEAIMVGNFMKARRCTECGRVMRTVPLAMAQCYLDEFTDRLGEAIKRAKPGRLLQLKGRLHEYPTRLAGKFLRETAYLYDLFLQPPEWKERR